MNRNSPSGADPMFPAAIKTINGSVDIFRGFPVTGIDGLEFGFDMSDPAYQPIFTRKQDLERLEAEGGTLCLALFSKRIIIGYAIAAAPSRTSRWAMVDSLPILELKAVEVAWPFRNQCIARDLLTCLFSGSDFDDQIVYLSAYAWLWDTAHTGLSCNDYREMLMRLYARFGFESFPTNDPNVCLKPENIFMARIGRNISSKDRECFKWLRFGITLPIRTISDGKAIENSGKNSYVPE